MHTYMTLQHIATLCNIQQYAATHCNSYLLMNTYVTLHDTETHCNILQHVATHSSTLHQLSLDAHLQHTAT